MIANHRRYFRSGKLDCQRTGCGGDVLISSRSQGFKGPN